jgi:hypothetical protein
MRVISGLAEDLVAPEEETEPCEAESSTLPVLRSFPHRTLLVIRWQCDDDKIDTTRYAPRTSTAIHADDMH